MRQAPDALKGPSLLPRNLGAMGCTLGLLLVVLGASPSSAAMVPAAYPLLDAPVDLSAEGLTLVATTSEDDILCVGAGNGEIQCDVRVYPCVGIACVWVCGLGQEDYRPCSLLPLSAATENTALAVFSGSSEDHLCFGWGSGDIDCIVRVYDCYGGHLGLCFWSCPTHEIDHGCDVLP